MTNKEKHHYDIRPTSSHHNQLIQSKGGRMWVDESVNERRRRVNHTHPERKKMSPDIRHVGLVLENKIVSLLKDKLEYHIEILANE
jgi:hypothetical protein